MSRAWSTAICRGEGANTKPTASAPMATARRPSSSVVMPQIFTNIAGKGTELPFGSGGTFLGSAGWTEAWPW